MAGAELAAYHERTAVLPAVEGNAVGTNGARGPLPARAQTDQRQAGMAEATDFSEKVEGHKRSKPGQGSRSVASVYREEQMSKKSIAEIAKEMAGIDIAILSTHTENGEKRTK